MDFYVWKLTHLYMTYFSASLKQKSTICGKMNAGNKISTSKSSSARKTESNDICFEKK